MSREILMIDVRLLIFRLVESASLSCEELKRRRLFPNRGCRRPINQRSAFQNQKWVPLYITCNQDL
jgi:hypothetical protein